MIPIAVESDLVRLKLRTALGFVYFWEFPGSGCRYQGLQYCRDGFTRASLKNHGSYQGFTCNVLFTRTSDSFSGIVAPNTVSCCSSSFKLVLFQLQNAKYTLLVWSLSN